MTDSGRVEISLSDPDDTTRRTAPADLRCRECGGVSTRGFPDHQPMPAYCCSEPPDWGWCARSRIVWRKVPGDE